VTDPPAQFDFYGYLDVFLCNLVATLILIHADTYRVAGSGKDAQ
jgi:hypothetical protein